MTAPEFLAWLSRAQPYLGHIDRRHRVVVVDAQPLVQVGQQQDLGVDHGLPVSSGDTEL